MVLSWWHIVLVLLVFLLLFGTGKISGLMVDFAKGVRSFKKEMNEEGAETESARLYAWDLKGPGELAQPAAIAIGRFGVGDGYDVHARGPEIETHQRIRSAGASEDFDGFDCLI